MRRHRLYLILLWLVFAGGRVVARDALQGESCTVKADEIRQGTLFVLCEMLDIRGTVQGNLIGVALRGSISGQINGSVYLLGGQVVLSGQVARDVHYAGLSLDIKPGAVREDDIRAGGTTTPIRGGLMSFTLSTSLAEGARIAGGVFSAGYQLLLHGQVDGEVNFWGGGLTLGGPVSGDVYASVGDPASDGSQIETLLLPFSFNIQAGRAGLVVTDRAVIAGKLDYSGIAPGTIPESLQNQPDKVIYTSTAVALPTLEEPGRLAIYFDQFVREASTLLSIGLMGLAFFPDLMRAPLGHLRARSVSSFSVGMLAFILSFPVVLIMLLLTVLILFILQVLTLSGVAVAVGAVLVMVDIGAISVFYFVAIFMARVLVGFAIGRFLMRLLRGESSSPRLGVVSMIIGVVVLALATSIPVIGWIFNAGALFLGLGSILSVVLEKFRKVRENVPVTAPDWYPPSSAVTRSYDVPPSGKPAPLAVMVDHEAVSAEPPDTAPAAPRQETPPPLLSPFTAPGMDNLPEGFDPHFFDE